MPPISWFNSRHLTALSFTMCVLAAPRSTCFDVFHAPDLLRDSWLILRQPFLCGTAIKVCADTPPTSMDYTSVLSHRRLLQSVVIFTSYAPLILPPYYLRRSWGSDCWTLVLIPLADNYVLSRPSVSSSFVPLGSHRRRSLATI